MVGVPAKQIGWMSQYGEQIPLPLEGEGEYVCPHTAQRYQLKNSHLSEIVDDTFIDPKLIPALHHIQERINSVLEHKYIMGPEVKDLEKACALHWREALHYGGERH